LRAVGASPKIEQVAGTGEPATSLALSAEGRLAVGDGRGRLVVRDLTAEGRPAVLDRTLEDEPIRVLRLGPDGLLAVGTESGVRLARVGRDGELPRLGGLDGPSSSLAFSIDGRWLAACNDQGDLALWDLADPS